MGARRTGRIIAFQTLYRYDCTGEPAEELLDFSWIDSARLAQIKETSLNFARLIILGTLSELERIDETIVRQLEHWDFSRLAKVDLAIIRMSAYCLLCQQNIPATVTIDEAVDIAKEFGSGDSYRFINGVLDGIRKQIASSGVSKGSV
jgi:N utilization substance protein B